MPSQKDNLLQLTNIWSQIKDYTFFMLTLNPYFKIQMNVQTIHKNLQKPK